MSRFPRIYAESTLKRMYGKLAVSEENVKLLFYYLEAMANFYGVLPIKDAYGIIFSQNSGIADEESFAAFAEIARHEEHSYRILSDDELYTDGKKSEPMERTLVLNRLTDDSSDGFYETAKAQQGKKLFVPAKDELLKYADIYYTEENTEAAALKDCLASVLKLSVKKQKELMNELIYISRFDYGNIYDNLNRAIIDKNVKMSENQSIALVKAFTDYVNASPSALNRGFSPRALSGSAPADNDPKAPKMVSFAPEIKQKLLSGELDINVFCNDILGSNAPESVKKQIESELKGVIGAKSIHAKVGRNDPCPCGSGKKYKKCCGR